MTVPVWTCLGRSPERSVSGGGVAAACRCFSLSIAIIAIQESIKRFSLWLAKKTNPGYKRPMMKPSQCRAARALLDWSQQQLADASKVGNATIRNFEGGKSSPQNATLEVLRRALEAAGVEFIPENGSGAGVRLKKSIVM